MKKRAPLPPGPRLAGERAQSHQRCSAHPFSQAAVASLQALLRAGGPQARLQARCARVPPLLLDLLDTLHGCPLLLASAVELLTLTLGPDAGAHAEAAAAEAPRRVEAAVQRAPQLPAIHTARRCRHASRRPCRPLVSLAVDAPLPMRCCHPCTRLLIRRIASS